MRHVGSKQKWKTKLPGIARLLRMKKDKNCVFKVVFINCIVIPNTKEEVNFSWEGKISNFFLQQFASHNKKKVIFFNFLNTAIAEIWVHQSPILLVKDQMTDATWCSCLWSCVGWLGLQHYWIAAACYVHRSGSLWSDPASINRLMFGDL